MSSPYAPPRAEGAGAPPPDIDAELDPSVANPPEVRRAGGVTMFAGLFATLAGFQTLDTIRLRGAFAAIPWAIMLVGLATVVVGAATFRARDWGVTAAIFVAGLLTVVTGGWLALSLLSGFVGFYSLFTLPLAASATLLCVLGRPACIRASQLRARLSADGLKLGL
jgi:hypothetical protein